MFGMVPAFPPFWIKFLAVGVLAFIATTAYGAYRLYSHGVAFAEVRNQAQASERAKMIAETQQLNLIALRADETHARAEREKILKERNDLQMRVDAAVSQVHAEREKYHKERDDLQMRVDTAEAQNESRECSINDIIILPGGESL